jgi:hypothetical protein
MIAKEQALGAEQKRGAVSASVSRQGLRERAEAIEGDDSVSVDLGGEYSTRKDHCTEC